jgi:hypothetical protein
MKRIIIEITDEKAILKTEGEFTDFELLGYFRFYERLMGSDMIDKTNRQRQILVRDEVEKELVTGTKTKKK